MQIFATGMKNPKVNVYCVLTCLAKEKFYVGLFDGGGIEGGLVAVVEVQVGTRHLAVVSSFSQMRRT